MTTSIDDIEIKDMFESRDEAEQETRKAKSKTQDLAKHLLMLRRRGAHLAMGYETWTSYAETEFDRSYRGVKYLIEFALFLEEIEETTGVTDSPLTEKGTRGSEAKETIADAVNTAVEKGEDPRKAMETAQEVAKEKAKRKPRTQGDGTIRQPKKPAAPAEATDEATDNRPPMSDLTADESDKQKLKPSTTTALHVTWSYEAWRTLTLACRDEHGAMMMRENFEDLMTSVDMELYAEDDSAQDDAA